MSDNDLSKCNYKLNLPYPSIKVDGPNSIYANEMLSNMAEVVSEMSDVSRYFYVSVIAKEKNSWISTCFHHISIVEMHHLNIFAELALLLGADPRLWSGLTHKRWWSPSFIYYSHDLRELVAESIKAEKDAITKYSRQAKTIKDSNIIAILHRIILDEQHHLQIFQEIYQQLL